MNSYEILVKMLKENKLSVSAAESCTGGMFISSLIGVPGASDIIGASFVVYSENAKMKIVDVKKSTIEDFGVVSENTALEMAMGAAKKAESDIGVGITGYAGPAVDENDASAGTVCFGFCFKGKTLSATKHFGNIGRNAVRELACIYSADTVIRLIKIYGDCND